MKGYPKFLVRKGMYTLPFNFRQVPVPTFFLSLSDLGAGAVNLVPTLARGSATPTFTRATTAYTVNSAGLLVPVGVGVARSAYDPTNLGYLGYLSEGSRINLCLQSETFDNVAWTKTGATVSANITTAPDGNITADKLVEDNANSLHFTAQSFTFPAAITQYAYSIWAKASGRNWLLFQLTGGVPVWGASNNPGAYVNISTGAVGTVANCTCVTQLYPNGWIKIILIPSPTTATGAAASINVHLASADGVASYLGDGVSGAFIWGIQLEVGAFVSSYIPTVAAAVTRNADVLTYQTASNLDNTVGSAYAEFTTSISSGLGVLGQGTNAEGTWLGYFNAGDLHSADLTLDGIIFAVFGTPFLIPTKVAQNWGTSRTGFKNGIIGQTIAFDGSFNIGANFGVANDAAGNNQIFGTIRNVKIWNKQLPNSLLQTIA